MGDNGWKKVGEFLKENAASGVGLVGSILTGNIPGAMATGASLVAAATGTDDPSAALARLQGDPTTMVRLKELANERDAEINRHIEAQELARLKDAQAEHAETQKTIRAGDLAEDKFVRRTRPSMAIGSLLVGLVYVLIATNPDELILATLMAPALVYMGLREIGKWKTADVLGKVARSGTAPPR